MNTSASPSLAALQARVQSHVLSGDGAALSDVLQAGAMSAAQRLGIYHHAYRARLLETMRDSFGHTLSYLGDEWFDLLALAFIEQHPSEHRNLRWYGQGWPAWLAREMVEGSSTGSHPEVAELASMDWALRCAFDAADAPCLTPQDLAALTPEDWASVVLHAQPCVAMLTVRHNTLSVWHALDQDEEVPPVEPLAQALCVLVWRHDERPHFRSLPEMEAHALTALMLGRSFASICEGLAQSWPNEDTASAAGACLRRWLDDGILLR